ncbi:MAG TPA: VOC family protein [Syntrophorhabdales bacterium]|nr:VOC family protein [Syntrophorhabdales bacterium]
MRKGEQEMEKGQKKSASLKIEHVCIAVRDRKKAMERFSAVLGTSFSRVFDVVFPDGIVHGRRKEYEGKLAFCEAGGMEIELIEPGKGPSIWREFLRAKGEGVHHIGAFVSDLSEELARFEKMGIGVLQRGEDEHVKFAFMDTESMIGVILEILERK